MSDTPTIIVKKSAGNRNNGRESSVQRPLKHSVSSASTTSTVSQQKFPLSATSLTTSITSSQPQSILRNSVYETKSLEAKVNTDIDQPHETPVSSHSIDQPEDSEEEEGEEEEEEEPEEGEIKNDNEQQQKKKRLSSKEEQSIITKTEQEMVVKYYKLDSFTQDIWLEDLESPVVTTPSSPTSNASPALITTPSLNKQTSFYVEAEDLVDPLHINEVAYREERRSLMKGKNVHENLISPSLLITSKNFSTSYYLLHVQATATYKQLEDGAEFLRKSIMQREEMMKNLFKTHFAKFVGAKSTIDSFYHEMRNRNLISSDDYGIEPFSKSLNGLNTEATKLYQPMLDRNLKAEKIRQTLSVLEQWKFFFALPGNINLLIKKRKYDAVVRDYNKGKNLMNSSFQKTSNPSGTSDDTLLPQRHSKVFMKVWSEVEIIINALKQDLFSQLVNDGVFTVDSKEKIMGYLINLDAKPDPVWYYLQSQFEVIVKKLNEFWEGYLASIESNDTRDLFDKPLTTIDLKKALHTIHTKEFEVFFHDDIDVSLWKITSTLIEQVCLLLNDDIKLFWNVCKIYFEDRLSVQEKQKVRNPSVLKPPELKKYTLCKDMLQQILSQTTAIITSSLHLSKTMQEVDSRILFAHPIKSAYFMKKIVEGLSNVREIKEVSELFDGFKGVVSKVKDRGVECVGEAWLLEAKSFYLYEDWEFTSITKFEITTTTTVKLFHRACKYIIRSLFYISHESSLEFIRVRFFESLLVFLDGVECLCVHWDPSCEMRNGIKPVLVNNKGVKRDSEEYIVDSMGWWEEEEDVQGVSYKKERIDIRRIDTRILVVLSNLSYVKSCMVPKLVSEFEKKFNVVVAVDKNDVFDTITHLEDILFSNYIRRKIRSINHLLVNGILLSGLDWNDLREPQGVRSFCHEVLLLLVMVHAHVSDVSKKFVVDVMSVLLHNLAQEMLCCFRKVDKFSPGGMLQAKLEVEFIQQTLSSYTTTTIRSIFACIYSTVESGVDEEETDREEMQKMFILGRELLEKAKANTLVQFKGLN